MHIINTLADMAPLENHKILPPDYLELIKEQFQVAYEYNQDGETEEEFTLEHCGPIFVLEKGDNVGDLSTLGLHSQQGGLMGVEPELVELQDLQWGRVWKVLVVYNNSYVPTFFLEAGKMGEEIDIFLASKLK